MAKGRYSVLRFWRTEDSMRSAALRMAYRVELGYNPSSTEVALSSRRAWWLREDEWPRGLPPPGYIRPLEGRMAK